MEDVVLQSVDLMRCFEDAETDSDESAGQRMNSLACQMIAIATDQFAALQSDMHTLASLCADVLDAHEEHDRFSPTKLPTCASAAVTPLDNNSGRVALQRAQEALKASAELLLANQPTLHPSVDTPQRNSQKPTTTSAPAPAPAPARSSAQDKDQNNLPPPQEKEEEEE